MIAKTELTGYPSIDQPWLKYYTEKDLENKAVGMTVFENIYQRCG